MKEMRRRPHPNLTQPPTGDGNNTSAFICRKITNQDY
jgi:hypothetical protein